MIARTRLSLLVSLVLVATLVPAVQAGADDIPTPSPTPTIEAVVPDLPPDEFEGAAYPSSGPGTVTIERWSSALVASPMNWPAGTTFSFQWYRGSKASRVTTKATGSGAKTDTYVPNAADGGKFLRVRITASNGAAFSGTAKRYSSAKNYSIAVAGSAVVMGFPAVAGQAVHLEWQELTQFLVDGEPLSTPPSLSLYQWLRNGKKIKGAKGATYTLTDKDIGKKISATVVLSAPAAAPTKIRSASSVVQGRPLTPLGNALTLSIGPGPKAGQLKANISGGFDQSGVTKSIRWFRDGAKISGATTSIFTMKSSDAGKLITFTVTAKKKNYEPRVFTAPGHRYGIEVSSPATVIPIYGTARVGGYLKVEYDLGGWAWISSETGATVSPTLRYQWYRDSKPIKGAVYSGYTLGTADYLTDITVRVFASGPGMVPTSSLSGAVANVGLGANYFDGEAGFFVNPAKNTLQAYLFEVLPITPAPVLTFQWTRDGVPIPGKTKSTYTLDDGADYDKDISVQITVHREKFEPGDDLYTLTAPGLDFTSKPSTTRPSFTTTPVYGATITAPTPVWVDSTGTEITTQANVVYQWGRSTDPLGNTTQPIAGANRETYKPTTADIGKYLIVTYGATIPGFLRPAHPSSNPSAQVQAATIAGTGSLSVTFEKSTLKAKMSGITTSGVSYSYRWFRNSIAVSGATKSTYKPSASTRGGEWRVIVTVTKKGHTPRTFDDGVTVFVT